MSDMVRPAIDNVIIVIEPGNHEESVSPRVAAHINRLQRERDAFRAVLEGMEFKAIDDIPGKGVTFARSLGCAAMLRARALIGVEPAPVARDIAESPK